MSAFPQIDFCNPAQLAKDKSPNSPKTMSRGTKTIGLQPEHDALEEALLETLRNQTEEYEGENKETITEIESGVRSVSYAANPTLRELANGTVVFSVDENAPYRFDGGNKDTSYHHIEAAGVSAYENCHPITVVIDCNTFRSKSDYRRMTQNGTEGCAVLERNTKETHLKDGMVIRPEDCEGNVPTGVIDHPGFTKDNLRTLGVTYYPDGKRLGFESDHPIVPLLADLMSRYTARLSKDSNEKGFGPIEFNEQMGAHVAFKSIAGEALKHVVDTWHDHVNIHTLKWELKTGFSTQEERKEPSPYETAYPTISALNPNNVLDVVESNLLDLETSCPTSGQYWKSMINASLDTRRRIGFTIVYKYKAYTRKIVSVIKE